MPLLPKTVDCSWHVVYHHIMQKGIKDLLGDVACKCVHHNISLKLESKQVVDEMEFPCSGFFDESNLVVATRKKNELDWVGTLIHESCHLDQCVEKCKEYIKDELGLFVVEDWIRGKQKDKNKAMRAFTRTIAMELDCEIRSVRKFKKYKIKFNEQEYIKQANAYLFSYVYAFVNKKWYPVPYEQTCIVKHMPAKFKKPNDYFSDYSLVEKHYK